MSPEELASRIHSGTDWYEFDARSWCEEAAAQLRRLAARVAELEAVGEPIAWLDDFGNAFPLAANKGAGSWVDDHKRTWKPLFTSPAVPLTDEQVFQDDGIMAANAKAALPLSLIMPIVRAVEAKHGITGSST
jgi:hypothetical protein